MENVNLHAVGDLSGTNASEGRGLTPGQDSEPQI